MSRARLRLLGAAAALALAAAAPFTPALAQTPMDDPLDARDAKRVDRMERVVRELRDIVFKGQKTGAPVVVQPADTDARMAEQANHISDLEQSLTRLNGSLEVTTHELDQARRATAALQTQVKLLSDRLAADEQKAAEVAAAATPPAPVQSVPPDPKAASADAFAQARQLMLGGDYDAAEAAFGAFVTTYPDTPRAPEARYWWGKTLLVRGDYARAASAFIGAIRDWPKTAWAPDAVVELSRALVSLKKPGDACQTLAELGRRYPKAPPAVVNHAAAIRAQAKCG
ncbi:tol-pal system protein YbgF [Phenylobacterium sp.]|uniref:tol-pal system protein YbgF n=1 Tax=Phenylobacterium sp. TaxID=1871053 RepID=UPI00286CBE8C|nr:tol-pal system protein YbgF [Phenylobacterium sp.]